jgi:hypothetical protein
MPKSKLTATENILFRQLEFGTENQKRTNPFSGESVMLTPEAVSVHDFIKTTEQTQNYELMETAIGIFIKKWPDEYMKLID